ncbi:hypothetical protein [Aquimarina agarivorans]|uniref:hypothetical protein n=1 Tax=Aquimarina agarivorans TaxID=980584 RepID=UPI0002EA2825|nr:hypothetical protein [Aquimarina agarivorans]
MLFVSGITAALSKQCAKELILCVQEAKKRGVRVGFDMNYRRKLWKEASAAREIFDEVLGMTDILFGNTGALNDVHHIQPKSTDSLQATLEAIGIAKEMFGVTHCAFTIRNHISASINELQAVFSSPEGNAISNQYTVGILDRFGTGDAFAAACLHGLGNNWEAQQLIEFGAAAFALKHTIYGDHHTSTNAEINAIVNGQTSGHVLR